MSDRNHFPDKIRSIFQSTPLEKIILWFTVGQRYSRWHSLFVPNHYQYPKGSIRLCERDGVRFETDISDLMDWYVYFGFREKEKKAFYKTIRKGDIVLDIGTNLGQISLMAAKKVGKNGKVLSVEPDAHNFKKLERNIALNPVSPIETFHVALGEKPGKGKMIIRDENNHGMNRVSDGGDDGDVTIQTIDLLFSTQSPEITHIKIDTEGYEYKILKGGIGLIKKSRPLLYIEIIDSNLRDHGDSPNEIFRLLNELDYRLTDAATGENLFVDGDYSGCLLDIIAKPN